MADIRTVKSCLIYPRSGYTTQNDIVLGRLKCDVLGIAEAIGIWHNPQDIVRGLETSMTSYPTDVRTLARRPSGFIPILMSLAALAVVIASLATTGPVRQPDEGPAAHLFQLLVVGQIPVLAFFAAKWARQHPRAVLTILAVQAGVLALALFPVWWFQL